jgi:FeS assembly SUF system protein
MTEEKNFLLLESQIVDAIKTIYDPEIPVNIYELGLIYDIRVDEQKIAHITMTLTAPNCPEAEYIPVEVHDKVKLVEGLADVEIILTFEPPWNPDLMSDEAKLELGML